MYISGPIKSKITDQNEALWIVKERKEIFSVDVKGHIDPNFWMKLFDFLQFLWM
jgi:hypothetical protein